MQSILLNPSHSLLRFSGADAGEFLQSQLTCDMNQLTESNLIAGAWCNPKGRIICYGYLIRVDHTIGFIVSRDLQEPVTQRLRMFVLRAKVGIDVDDSYDIVGWLGFHDTPLPAGRCWPLTGGEARHISLVQRGDTTSLDKAVEIGDDASWRIARIRAGEPWINAANTESLLPEHVNLDLSGAVSFEKGCFPGQEVVARMHYKGKGKTRLFTAKLAVNDDDDRSAPPPGTRIVDAESRAAGVVVEAALRGEALLATLTAPSDSADGGRMLFLDDPQWAGKQLVL